MAAVTPTPSSTPSYVRRKTNNSGDDRASINSNSSYHEANEMEYIVAPPEVEPTAVSERFREFYALLEDDLRSGNGGRALLGGRRKGGRNNKVKGTTGNQYYDDETTTSMAEKKGESETRVVEILEVVERTVCSLFYDRWLIFFFSSLFAFFFPYPCFPISLPFFSSLLYGMTDQFFKGYLS
jgi:hypothetical protein